MAMNCLVFNGQKSNLSPSAKSTKLQPRLCVTVSMPFTIAVTNVTMGSSHDVASRTCKTYLSVPVGRAHGVPEVIRNRIVASGVQGVTFNKALRGKDTSANHAVFRDGCGGVLRTGRVEAAC